MGLYTFRLIFLQLVNGDDFKAKATTTTDYKDVYKRQAWKRR